VSITLQLRALRSERLLVGHVHPRLLAAAWAAAPGKVLALAHGDDFLAARRRWHWPLTHRLLQTADPVVCHAQPLADRLAGMGLPAPVVIRPGVDPQRFSPPVRAPSGPLTMLTVGRLVARKGHDTVLLALSRLRPAFPELRYWIAGEGPHRAQLERLVKQLVLGEAVQFLGRVPPAELPALYRKAHLFVMPAREDPAAATIEGFGLVYLEASASGLAVVAAQSGGAPEAVRHEQTGVLVPPGDPLALAGALASLLGDPSRRRALGQGGRRWVESEMNWSRVAADWLRVLDLEDR
jgi:phosphatidylinositol alpha-1,6-mannosyltransferase